VWRDPNEAARSPAGSPARDPQWCHELIARHRPHAIAVEDVFYAKNVRTTVVLGHARGVVLLAGAQARIDVYEFPPAEIKKAVVGSVAQRRNKCSSCSRDCFD
jgi:crossover junction endodeoxyribonuclease RuvC